jgi:hypothetical protein
MRPSWRQTGGLVASPWCASNEASRVERRSTSRATEARELRMSHAVRGSDVSSSSACVIACQPGEIAPVRTGPSVVIANHQPSAGDTCTSVHGA